MDVILQEMNAGILILTLNRPEKLNALNQAVLLSLEQALCRARDDKDIRGILITGTGKAFCAGADISKLAECDAQTGYTFACEGQRVFRALETLGKPSLAAVNGFAFGGGCELAMAATLRMASETAQFGQPEVKLGVIPGYGGTQRLARLVGKGRALDLCLTSRFIDAQTAYAWGLVTEVCAPDQLLALALQRLHSICFEMGPSAVSAVMEVIDRGYDLPLEEGLHLEALHFAKTCATQDKTEGVSAFLEKRRPEFTGV